MSTPRVVTTRVVFPFPGPEDSSNSSLDLGRSPPAEAMRFSAGSLIGAPAGVEPSTKEARTPLHDCADDLAQHAATCRAMAGRYEMAGSLNESMDMWLQHLAIVQRLGDSAGICTSYGRIGAAQEKMGNHSAALESLTLQLSLAEEIESLNEQISAVGNLGVTCRSLERYDQAATYFQEQLRLSKEGKDIAGQINAYGNMSVLFRKMGRHDEAMDMLSKQLEVADDALPSNPSTPLREGPQSTCAAPHTQPGAIALPNDVMSTEQPHVVATRTPRMDGDKTCVKKELSTTVEGSNSTGAALSTQPGDIALPNDERSKEQPRVVASRKLRMDGKETSAEVEFGHRCTTVEEQNLAEKVKVPKLCRSAPPFHVPKDPVQTSEKLDPNGGDQRAKAMEHAKSVLQALSMMAREGEEPRPADSRKLTDADVSTAAEMTGDRKPAPAKSKSALVDRTNSASRRQELDGASIGGDSKASGKRRDGDAAAGPERLHGGTMAVCTEEAAPKAAPEMQSVVTQDPAACLQEQELKDTARRAAQRLARKLDDLCKQKDWNGALALEKRVLKCVHDTEGMSPRLAVFMYGRLAIAYEQQGSCPEAAIGLHGKIIQLARSLGDSNLEAATLECKADGCISLDDYEGASAALTRLVELLDKLGDDQALLDSYAKLFDVYGKLGHRIKMLDTIRKLLSRTERAGDLLAQGAALTKMAQALSVMGNFEEARRTRATARSVQTKAVQHYSTQLSSGDSRVQAAACVKLATVYKDLGRHTEAIDMRAKAKILAARLGALPMERVRTHPGTMPFDFDPQDNSIEESEQESSSMSDDDEFPAPSPPTLPRLTPAALSRKGSQDPVQHGAAGSEQSTPSPFATGNLSPECPPEDQEAPNTNKRSENPPLVAGPTPESSPVARTPQDKVRRIAGPTPESSPGPHAPQDQVIAAHILKANDMCEDTMDDMSKMESAVLELLRLCQNEEWKTAASMHGRMVPVAAKLAESEPRMASSIYGNLGFALESLAEEVENPADGLTLWMEAITMHQRARSIACSIGDLSAEGNACSHLGIAYSAMENFDDAITMLKRCYDIASAMQDEPGQCQTLGKLANIYYLKGEFAQAIDSLRKQLSLAQAMGDSAGEAATCGNLGAVYASLDQHGDALNMFQMHIDLAQELGDVGGQAQTCFNMATSFEKLGMQEEMIECLGKVRQLTHQISDFAGQAEASGRLASVLIAAGHLENGMTFLAESVDLFETCGMVEQQGQALQTLGTLKLGRGNCSQAAEYLVKAKDIAMRMNKTAALGKICANLGIVKLRLGAYAEAIELQETAQTISVMLNDLPAQAAALGNLGTCYHKLGRNDEALSLLNKYCEIALQIEDNEGLCRTYTHIGAIHRKMNKHSEAVQWFAKAKLLKNDEKNVVGDQPMSENVLSQFKFPAAAARRTITLECIEEWPSPGAHNTSGEASPGLSSQENSEYETNWLSEGYSVTDSSCSTSSDLEKSPFGTHRSPPAGDHQLVAKQLDLSLQMEMGTPRTWKEDEDGDGEAKCAEDAISKDRTLCGDESICSTPRVLVDEQRFSEEADRLSNEEERRQQEERERRQFEQEIAEANKEEEQLSFSLAAIALSGANAMLSPVRVQDADESDDNEEACNMSVKEEDGNVDEIQHQGMLDIELRAACSGLESHDDADEVVDQGVRAMESRDACGGGESESENEPVAAISCAQPPCANLFNNELHTDDKNAPNFEADDVLVPPPRHDLATQQMKSTDDEHEDRNDAAVLELDTSEGVLTHSVDNASAFAEVRAVTEAIILEEVESHEAGGSFSKHDDERAECRMHHTEEGTGLIEGQEQVQKREQASSEAIDMAVHDRAVNGEDQLTMSRRENNEDQFEEERTDTNGAAETLNIGALNIKPSFSIEEHVRSQTTSSTTDSDEAGAEMEVAQQEPAPSQAQVSGFGVVTFNQEGTHGTDPSLHSAPTAAEDNDPSQSPEGGILIDDTLLLASSRMISLPLTPRTQTPRTPRTPRSMYAWLHVGVDSHREAYPISPRVNSRPRSAEGSGAGWGSEENVHEATAEQACAKSVGPQGSLIPAPSPRAVMPFSPSKMFSWLHMDGAQSKTGVLPASPRSSPRDTRDVSSLEFGAPAPIPSPSTSEPSYSEETSLPQISTSKQINDTNANMGDVRQPNRTGMTMAASKRESLNSLPSMDSSIRHVDPHVNPTCGLAMANHGNNLLPNLVSSIHSSPRSSSARSSESRPEEREVLVDCYWLPELIAPSSLNGNFADWIVQAVEHDGRAPSGESTTRTPRALSPVLIPEMSDSLNLVCVSELYVNSPDILASEDFSSESRYLF